MTTEPTILYTEQIGEFEPVSQIISYKDYLEYFGNAPKLKDESRSHYVKLPSGVYHHTKQVNIHRSGLVAVRTFKFQLNNL